MKRVMKHASAASSETLGLVERSEVGVCASGIIAALRGEPFSHAVGCLNQAE